MHLYYPSVYQDMAGTKRDISGGREFSYVSATEYTMQVFDRVNDSRFWKSFITCYGANDTNGAPTWTKEDIASGYAPAGAKEGDKRFVAGELGLKYIVNNPGDTRYESYVNDPTQNVLKTVLFVIPILMFAISKAKLIAGMYPLIQATIMVSFLTNVL